MSGGAGTAWTAIRRDAFELAETDARLLDALAQRDLDGVESRLHDRGRLLESLGRAAEALATSPDAPEGSSEREAAVEELCAANQRSRHLESALCRILEETRGSLSATKAGSTLAQHASSRGPERRGGWCDIRR